MCGIAGFLTSAPGTEADLSVTVGCMADELAHRGPDDSGTWVDAQAGIALGHRRLSILDLSPDGHQPMHSASGRYVMVFNGEVYNFWDLRRALESRGHTFRGHSDTEVMLAAIEEWDIDEALSRFNGMFAFAVWDRQDRRLQLARDRLGEKPLYYGWMRNTFLFGSELKAFVAHPDFAPEINRDALALHLRYGCIPAPYSVYRGIHKLLPGTRLALKLSDRANARAPIPYWSAEEVACRALDDPFDGSADDATVCLDELLRDGVKMRMVADVPLGAFLSGGVDSSTLVALMQAQSTRPVKTFSIGFHEDSYNEAKHAAAVAKHLGTEHTEFYVSPADAMRVIPKLPTFYDEPFSDSSQIPTYLVAALARAHVTVSLSGDGGDELFGGYKRYFTWGAAWNRIGWMPQPFLDAASWGLRRMRPQQWNHLARLAWPLLPEAARVDAPGDKVYRLAQILAAQDSPSRYQATVSAWQSPDSVVQGGQEPPNFIHERCQSLESPDFRHHLMFLDAVVYLPDDILVKVDRATMAVALEARAPYLDHRVVEFAARLPMNMKFRDGQGKWILRRLLEWYVPKELTDRPKKGFSLPIGDWLRGPLRDWAEDLLHERRLKGEGFFHAGTVRQRWEEHLSGRRDLRHHLWALLMFQAWLDRWSKPAGRAAEGPRVPASSAAMVA